MRNSNNWRTSLSSLLLSSRHAGSLVMNIIRRRLSGIDVSHMQGNIDWHQVAASGIKFSLIKATEGGDFADPLFARNWAGTKDAGIIRGAYHFFRPQIRVNAQVDNFLKTLGKLEVGDLPPCLDLEVPEDWQTIMLSKRLLFIVDWLDAIETTLGLRPIVYVNRFFVQDVIRGNANILNQYRLWLAEYTQNSHPQIPAPWKNWTFWQHSETGNIPGIAGRVDLDLFNGTSEDLTKLLVNAIHSKSARTGGSLISSKSTVVR